MIHTLKPYPAYKDANLPWLGRVPQHWAEQRAKYFFREVDERSTTGEEELLSVSHVTGVTPRKQNVTMFMAESNVGHKVCRPGDLVINTMWAFMAALGVAKQTGVVSPSYGVYRPRQPGCLLPDFVDHLLRVDAYKSEYLCRSTGIRASRLRLYPEQFLRIPILCPPPVEQAAIVRFLDHFERRVRRYIRAKRRIIDLLNERKRAIIYRAVVRGLDPNVRLKPSGVEWLGEVPEDWIASRIKNEFACLNRHRIPLSGSQRGEMTLRQYDYYGASGVIDKVDAYIFDDELLLIAEDGANLVLRNLPLAIIARGKFWVNNHAHILKPKRGNLEYLAHRLEMLSYLPWISGAAQPKLTKDRLMSIGIAVPPPEEQDKISKQLQAETKSFCDAIICLQKEVDAVREYRSRLVADVVIGKLDVREVATCLPTEGEEAEPIDDNDALMDAADEADFDAVPEEADA
jgi:type I restriction enzyme S subunit